jgi:hypothetical protein
LRFWLWLWLFFFWIGIGFVSTCFPRVFVIRKSLSLFSHALDERLWCIALISAFECFVYVTAMTFNLPHIPSPVPIYKYLLQDGQVY